MGPIRPLGVLCACLALAGGRAWSAEPGSRIIFAWPPTETQIPAREVIEEPEETEETDEPVVELAQDTPATTRPTPNQRPAGSAGTPAQRPPGTGAALRPGTAQPATPSPSRPAAPGAPTARATPPAVQPPAPGTSSDALAPGLARATQTGSADTTDRSLLSGLTYNDAPIMLGDQAPLAMRVFPRAALPNPPIPVPPVPPIPPRPGPLRLTGAPVLPSVRGFKIADNQSPAPQDRVFFSFNDFTNVNKAVNKAFGSPVAGIQVYREILGIEKTFLDQQASIGLRMPIDSLYAHSPVRPLQGMSSSVGNISVFGKYVLWRDEKTGSLISGGLALTMPTGPGHFAGSHVGYGFRNTQIAPFLGFFFAFDKLYVQGFTSVDIATDPNDVTLYYNDIGVGYFLYRSNDPSSFLRAFVPTFEVHVNDPLNHRGAFKFNDPAGTPDIVDFTYAANILLGKQTLISTGIVTPVTGPRPFDLEYVLLLNVYFGKSKARNAPQRLPILPPVVGM